MSEHSDPCICLPLPEPVNEYCPVHGDDGFNAANGISQRREQQEWTPEHVSILLSHGGGECVSDAHNAALAAAWQEHDDVVSAIKQLGAANQELNRQLADERQHREEAEQSRERLRLAELDRVIAWLQRNEQAIQGANLLNTEENRKWRDTLAKVKDSKMSMLTGYSAYSVKEDKK